MSNNSELNPVVIESENAAVGEQIFRPNVDNLNTDTAESRILTPVTDVNYHSIENRDNRDRHNDVAQTREAESLRSIIERLDNGDDQNDEGADNLTLDSQESDIRSMITEEYNKVMSTMRVDMVSIIKLLQTLHPKVNEQTDEIDNIKEDIYNLVQAVRSLRDKIEEANTLTIRRQQKYAGKVEDQISKICSRLEALERANFTTAEPVNREGQRPRSNDQSTSQVRTRDASNSNSRSTNTTRQVAKKDGSPQSTREIYDAMGHGRQKSIRVRPKREKPTRDQVGINNITPGAYNTSSRMANRMGKFEDTVNKETIKATKLAKRGLKDTVNAKVARKPRRDVIQSIPKSGSKSRTPDTESEDRDSRDSPTEDSDAETESEDNGKNIQVFRA